MQISWQRYSATSLTSPCLQALFSFYVRHHCVFPQENCYHQPNDYRPVALTSTVMKCCEKLVLRHIKSSLPPTLDQHQFAYRANRSTEDTINTALHIALTHLEHLGTYIWMLFEDLSSVFNTKIPSRMMTKLLDLGVSQHRCRWIRTFWLMGHRLSGWAIITPHPWHWSSTGLLAVSLTLLFLHPQLHTNPHHKCHH